MACYSADTRNLAQTRRDMKKKIVFSFLRDPSCFSLILNNENVFLQKSCSFKRLYVFRQSILLLWSWWSESLSTT